MGQLKILSASHIDALQLDGMRVQILAAYRDKLVGLLRSGKHSPAVALMHCSSVHTFGMKYAIDLAFIDRDGHVIRVCHNVRPGDVRSKFGSWVVLERPAKESAWLRTGQRAWLMQENA